MKIEQDLEQGRSRKPTATGIEGRGALSTEEALRYLNLGRTKFYDEIASGRLRVRKAGRKTLILIDDADEYLRALPTIRDYEPA